ATGRAASTRARGRPERDRRLRRAHRSARAQSGAGGASTRPGPVAGRRPDRGWPERGSSIPGTTRRHADLFPTKFDSILVAGRARARSVAGRESTSARQPGVPPAMLVRFLTRFFVLHLVLALLSAGFWLMQPDERWSPIGS